MNASWLSAEELDYLTDYMEFRVLDTIQVCIICNLGILVIIE